RFSYVRNNPIRYRDPNGHTPCTDDGYCGNNLSTVAQYWDGVIKEVSGNYGITFQGNWKQEDQISALIGAIVVSGALSKHTNLSTQDSFQAVFGKLTFERSTSNPGNGDVWAQYGTGTITFYAGATQWTTLVAHELGHAFNARIANNGGVTPYSTLAQNGIFTNNGEQIAGNMAGYTVPGTGFTCGNRGNQQCFGENMNGVRVAIPANHYWRTKSGLGFDHGYGSTPNEDFADIFANWATNSFTNDGYGYGEARSNFMTTNMSEWVNSAMGGN